MRKAVLIAVAALAIGAPLVHGQGYLCEDQFNAVQPSILELPPPPPPPDDPLRDSILRYAKFQLGHKLRGLASYYSAFFDGRRTANGEIYRNKRYSAAHLTLPLGSWVEVTSRATGKSLRLRVNDRGPYARKFILDLSYAAAHYLGVDKSADRHVDVRVIALPGEEPLPEDVDVESFAPVETAAQ